MTQVMLVYASQGVKVDFAKHISAEVDADLYAEVLTTLFVYDSPLTVLETTLTTTGAAQNLDMIAPILGDANVADETRIVGVDIAFQLNDFTIPKSDMKFELQFLDSTGTILGSRTQSIEGNVASQSGNTRQYMRMLCFEQNSTMTALGVTSIQDGKLVSLPRFRSVNTANLAIFLAATGLTVAQARTLFPSFSTDVATIRVAIPAGAFTAGVGLTASPITIGRLNIVADIIQSLDSLKSAAGAPMIDEGRAGLLVQLSQFLTK